MKDIQAIYQTVKRTGGSGRGASYWAIPAMCGRKRKLMTDNPDVDPIQDRTALDLGTYYHFLKEVWLSEQIDDDIILDADPIQDAEWGEALRLFSWHRDMFPRNYWGQIVAVELKLPVNPEHKAAIEAWLGHVEATGACDLVVRMSGADVARIEEDREVELNGPGIYIIDHKTAASRKSEMDGRAHYTSSIQCLTYMHMLGMAINEPIRGMVFDVLVKHKVLRRYPEGKGGSSVQTFVAKPRDENPMIVKSAIGYGMHQREHNLANPFACYDHGRECVFLSRGMCGRY